MSRGTDMDAVTIKTARERFRIQDQVQMVEYPNVKGKAGWLTIRLFGPVYSMANFWVRANRDDPKKKFSVPCRCYDPSVHQVVPEKYDPWYDYYRKECDENVDNSDRMIQYNRAFYMQCIVRKLEDQMPSKNSLTAEEKKTHIKDMESDSFTPVRVIKLTAKVFRAIQEMKEDNVVKLKSGTRKAYNVSDEKYGRDIMIKFDNSKGVAPGDMYQVKLVVDGGRTPLTEEEREFLTFDMESIYEPEMSESDVKRDYESWARRNGILASKKSKKDADDLDDDIDTDSDDDFDDEDEKPVKKSKKPVKKSKKVVDDDDDFDDEDEDFDDDEDEKPVKKSKKVVDDDDDEDDDFDDDDPPFDTPKKKRSNEDDEDFDDEDDEDEKPVKKSKKPVKKSKKVVDDDDDFEDDDDDFDDEDDEDEKPSKKPAKKSKKVVDDDDDFDEDDFDDDEDEKPVKKSKKPVKKSKKVVDDDDDFDDEDDEY